MGKSLIIKGADFSQNAISKIPYSYTEDVTLSANVSKTISCNVKQGKIYAIYIDGKLPANTLTISQSGNNLSRFQLSNNSNVRSDNSGTVFTATANGTIDITATGAGTYTINIVEVEYVTQKSVSYNSGETVIQLTQGRKYFIAISNVVITGTASVYCPYLIFNNLNKGVFQGIESIDIGGYYIDASVTGNLTVGKGFPATTETYTVTVYLF